MDESQIQAYENSCKKSPDFRAGFRDARRSRKKLVYHNEAMQFWYDLGYNWYSRNPDLFEED